MIIPAGTHIARYEIISPLGAGGMGEVYLARDTELGRTVALKCLPETLVSNKERMQRFLQEAQTVSALNHPNILTVHDFGTSDSRHFLVTEYVEGVTLRQKISASKISTAEALDVAIQAAEALSAAHGAGVIHRDIKPENIMVRGDGYVKVLDFGLAKLTNPKVDSDAPTLIDTSAGIVMGTVQYMAPEQARGLKVDERTDLFSLGVVLYEMLTGVIPFQGPTKSDVLVAILERNPKPVNECSPDIPSGLAKIVHKLLAKDPEHRYQKARELIVDLKKVKEDSVKPAPKLLAGFQNKGLWSRVALISVAFLIVVFAASYLLRNRFRSAPPKDGETITLAILPFRALNEQSEIGFLSLGIPDAIITRLANFQRVRVRPTSAILRYDNQNFDPQEVGRSLATEFVVTGTIQKAADRLHVAVQLTRIGDSAPMWGKVFDRGSADILTLQDGIAEQVATALRINMSAKEKERFYKRYTDNIQAYESYVRGRSQLAGATKEGVVASLKDFENALALDPNYALARSGVAMACAQMHLYFAPQSELKSWGERAKQEAQIAIELDPGLAETHQALAAIYGKTEFNWDATIRECDQALELNPSLDLPHYFRGRAFYHLGLLEQADWDVRDGLELNPSQSNSENLFEALRTKGIVAFLAGRYDEGTTTLEEVHRLSSGPVADWWLAQVYYYAGHVQQSEDLLKALSATSSASAATRSKVFLASVLAARGERMEAERLANSVAKGTYMDHHVAYALGTAYAQLSRPEEAVQWLRKAAETGFPCSPWYARDPLLDPLRQDSRFQKLLAELQQSTELAKARYKL